MTAKHKDEVGNTYGKLTVLRFDKTDKESAFWVCKCECGGEKVTRGSTLRSGQCKSCGNCDIQKPMSRLAPVRRHFQMVKVGAKTRNLSFNLSLEQFITVTNQPCHYCGNTACDKHTAPSKRGKEFYPIIYSNGLDRVDSSVGYETSNIVPCCFMCNRLKSNFALSEFLKKIKEIYDHQSLGIH